MPEKVIAMVNQKDTTLSDVMSSALMARLFQADGESFSLYRPEKHCWAFHGCGGVDENRERD